MKEIKKVQVCKGRDISVSSLTEVLKLEQSDNGNSKTQMILEACTESKIPRNPQLSQKERMLKNLFT